MPYLFFDYYYIIFVIPAIIFSLIIQFKLKSTYAKFSKVGNARRITGAQAAHMVLNYYGISDVNIVPTNGIMTDHYDPTQKVIRLSDGVFNSSSIAAVGIACHEAGHAAQHAENYAPIRIRNSILPVCNIGSSLSIPLLIAGVIFSLEPLVWIGIGFFAFTAVFQFVTLPVEFNASRRALVMLKTQGILGDDELVYTRKVLGAAALTYVASAAAAILQLLRIILLFGGRDRD